MKHKSPYFFPVILFAIICIASANAQVKNSPYKMGETLYYEGKANKIIFRGVSIADLRFSVSEDAKKQNFLIDAEAVSKGSLLKLFGFKFFQKISSTVDGKTFSVLKTAKRDEQDERIRDSVADFNYPEKTVTYIEIDPKNTARPPRRIASAIEKDTYDLVSSIYALRAFPLAVGKTFLVNVSDSGFVYKVPVRVTRREIQNTVLGKIICFRIEPDIFGNGKMIEQKGSMVIWITDDSRRLPVRSQIETSLGRVEVKLRRMEIQDR